MTDKTDPGLKEIIILLLLIAGLFGLLFLINDHQMNEWHKENDICNLTCIHSLETNQYLDEYYLVHKDVTVESSDQICACTIHACNSNVCSIYETKTIFVNKSIIK